MDAGPDGRGVPVLEAGPVGAACGGVDADRTISIHDPGNTVGTERRDIYSMDRNQIINFWGGDITRIRGVYAISPTSELAAGTWTFSQQ